MIIAQRKLLIALLALCCSTAVVAADAPKAEPAKEAKDEKKDEKKDGKEAKPEAPAEPELPSKPYPKNATPKAFEPKRDTKADAGQDKPAEKAAEKPADKAADKTAKPGADKPADKHAADKPADKAADKHAADKHGADKHGADKSGDAHAAKKPDTAPHKVVKKHRPAHQAQAKPAAPADPAMVQLAHEAAGLKQDARSRDSYVVQAKDSLDSVIRKTLPANLFSADVLRQAYLRANPALLTLANVKLRPGQVLKVPDVATVRAVVMGEGGEQKPSLHSTAPVLAPTVAPTAAELNPPIAIPRLPVDVASSHRPAPEVSAEEKKKWVRYP